MTKKKTYYDRVERDSKRQVRWGISGGLGWLAFIVVLIVGLTLMYRYVRPFQEETRTLTFQQSTAHIQGLVRSIEKYRADYFDSDNKDHRSALREMALNDANKLDDDDIPEHLKAWITELRTPNPNKK